MGSTEGLSNFLQMKHNQEEALLGPQPMAGPGLPSGPSACTHSPVPSSPSPFCRDKLLSSITSSRL